MSFDKDDQLERDGAYVEKMRREVVISYDPADLPEGDFDRESYQYDFERDLATGAEAVGWTKVPVKVEYRDVLAALTSSTAFTKGDRVRCTEADRWIWAPNTAGTVIRVDGSSVFVHWDDSLAQDEMRASELELVR